MSDGKWLVLTTAPDQISAEMIVTLLDESGISARVDAGDVQSFLGLSTRPCRILVDSARAGDAARLLEENGIGV